jgi:hypothetical protein
MKQERSKPAGLASELIVGSFQFEGPGIFLNPDNGKMQAVRTFVFIRKVNQAEHEQRSVPSVFAEFRDLANVVAACRAPDRRNILDLT